MELGATVQGLKKNFESNLEINQNERAHIEQVPKDRFQKVLRKCATFMSTSRFAGIPLALLYGFYVYYLVTWLILSEPSIQSFNDVGTQKNSSFNISK